MYFIPSRSRFCSSVGNGVFNSASLDLFFAKTKSLVDATTGANLVTFTRASSGTYVGSDGLIKTATTNLLLQSEDFSTTWSATLSSVTANTAMAPSGTSTADTLAVTNGSTVLNAFISQDITKAASATTYTYSVYAKQAGFNRLTLTAHEAANLNNRGIVTVSLVDGSIASAASAVGTFTAASATVTKLDSSWYRIALTFTTGTETTLRLRVSARDSSATTGDGTSGIYIWGAQLEQSSTVGEYVKTTSTINSAARFDHNPTTGESLGLLVEESRTNNLLQSEDFTTTWTQNNVTVATNTVTAPDGTTTADTFGPVVGDGLTTTRFLRQNPVLTTQGAYTFSVFVKVGTATTNGIALYISDGTATNNFRANFNLFTLNTPAISTGWATPTATIIPYPNGWYRCILSGVTSTAHSSLRALIYLNFFGNTADTYGTIHIWGAQLEAGAFPTSYTATTTATVTRSADVASISGSNFSSWYRQDEGTIYADFQRESLIPNGTFSNVWSFSNNTNDERFLSYLVGPSRMDLLVTDNGQRKPFCLGRLQLLPARVLGKVSPTKLTILQLVRTEALSSRIAAEHCQPQIAFTLEVIPLDLEAGQEHLGA